MDEHRFAFVGGLHRSGTTLVADLLSDHPQASGLEGTGVPADEGQHLQDVLPPAKAYGGAGKFAFDADARAAEDHPEAGRDAGKRMFDAWAPHWDLEAPVLVEKSPPNLLRFRFLQASFPDAHCVAVVRHPAAVVLATHKWSTVNTLERQVRHWVAAHEAFLQDQAHLDRGHVLRYEDLVAEPEAELADLHRFLDLEPLPPRREIDPSVNERYLDRWRDERDRLLRGRYIRWIERRHEEDVRRFGYSLEDLDRVEPWPGPSDGS